MAYIRNRGPFQFQVEVKKAGFPSQTKTFETLAEARAWAAVIESEMVRGVFVDRTEVEKLTLGDLLERYLVEVTPGKRSSKVETYRVRRLMAHPLARRRLSTLTSADFSRFRQERLKTVGAGSVRNDLGTLSHVFGVAAREWGLAVSNPVSSVAKPPMPRGRERRLTDEELARLLEAARQLPGDRGREMPVIIELAIETGLRRDNLLFLKWKHINLQARTVHVPQTKNGDPLTAPLSRRAVELLSGLPRRLDGRVFSAWGTGGGLGKAFARLAAGCGISDIHFHDLRHEAASRRAPFVPAPTLAKLMGWKSISMAMRYYNPTAQELVDVIDRADAARAG